MRKMLSVLGTVLIAATLTVASTSTASAADEVLACRIVPAPGGTPFTSPRCSNRQAYSGTYSVGFVVQNPPAGAHFAWTLPAGYPATYDCTDTYDCAVGARSSYDQDIPVSVAVTANGVVTTLRATASIAAVCGKVYC